MATWVDVHMTGDKFSQDRWGRAKATLTYYAEADAFAFCDEALAANDGTTSIPVLGEAYSTTRPGCLVVARDVQRMGKSPNKFEVTISLEDPTDGSVVGALTSMPATVVVSYDEQGEEYTIDADGNPVVNTAHSPFDSAPQRVGAIKNYNFEKYVDASTKAAIEAAYRTNNASATSIDGISHPTDTLLLVSPTFLPVQVGVYRASWVVKFNPKKWKDTTPNVGYSQLVGGVLTDCKQKDASGQDVPVSRPVPLDTDGSQLDPVPSDPTTWPTLDFYPYSQAAWTGVPLS